MADTTTAEYAALREAANSAFSRIGTWQETTIANNGRMNMSMADMQRQIERINTLRINSTSLESITRLDNLSGRFQQRIDSVNQYSDTRNGVQAQEAGGSGGGDKEDFPINALLGAAGGLIKMGLQQSAEVTEKWNQLNATFTNVGNSIGAALMPVMGGLIDNCLMPMAQWLEVGARWLGSHTDLVGQLAAVIGGALIGYKAWAMGQALVNTLMTLSPMGMIVAGIVALVAGLIYAWNTFAGFRGTVMGVLETLWQFGKIIFDIVIGPIKGMISGIGGLGKALLYMFQGDFQKAFDTGLEAAKDLSGVTLVQKVVSDVKGMGPEVSKAYDYGKNLPGLSLKGLAPSADLLPSAPAKGKGKGGEAGLAGAGEAVNGITSGGTRNVTLNLQKLFDNINISTTTVTESISDIEQKVTDALIRILNNANAVI